MLPNLEPREKGLLLLLLAVLLGAGFYFILSQQMKDYIAAGQLLEAKQNQLRAAESLLNAKVNEQKQTGQAKEKLEQYLSFFDTDFSQGSALLMLSFKAMDLDVAITNLEPGGLINREYYLALPVKLSFSGSYHAVAQLIGELERLPNLTEIRLLKITAAPNTSGGNASAWSGTFAGPAEVKVNAVCELIIYSSQAPGNDFNLEQQIIQTWQTGREDLFKTPAPTSPHPLVPPPQVEPEAKPPEPAEPEPDASEQGAEQLLPAPEAAPEAGNVN